MLTHRCSPSTIHHPPFTIHAFQPVSLSDFPGRVAAVVFTRGCNFRCPYCHNPDLIPEAPQPGMNEVAMKDFFSFLEQRGGKLDGVVISGGEPTQQEGLFPFIRRLRRLGIAIKLDTNGSRPGVLEILLKEGLTDYIAMDIKAPPEKYNIVAGQSVDVENILKSIKLLITEGSSNRDFQYEFRTTVALSLLNEEDITACGRMALGARRYILQPLRSGGNLEPSTAKLEALASRLHRLGIAALARAV